MGAVTPLGVYHVHENMQTVSIEEPDGSEIGAIAHGLGRIITTNLNRTLMPMIKYAIGDAGRWYHGHNYIGHNYMPAGGITARRVAVGGCCGEWSCMGGAMGGSD